MENEDNLREDKSINCIQIFLKVIAFIIVLYIFLLSIQLMGASLKMFGHGLAESLMAMTSNPFVGLFIGILATSIIQSSSTTTSILVGLVAGGIIPVPCAIPIVMGANIGTSITNTIVSLGHVTRRDEFKRAFAGAVVHDFFNLLAVIILFPLELIFHPLEQMSLWLTKIFVNVGGFTFVSPLKIILDPAIHFLKESVNSPALLLTVSFMALFLSLIFLVRLMKSLIIGRIEIIIDSYLFKNIFTAFVLGIILTAVIQSSSVTTSLVVPLVGAGILTVRKIYPYTLGANIGTTVTAMLAALVTLAPEAITVAFSHLMFNILGILIISSLFRYLPVTLAEKFSEICSKKRRLALLYVISTFFIIPLLLIFLTK
ncbi:Na/Pi symporter [Patescibacteria group bacterium]|nr:Na/Pi symporter [Patescibacteria group bacterium]